MVLEKADRFSFEELTKAYNRTRVDYLVPMPMNEAKLREYVHIYDVDLSHSCVALNEEDMILGLGMLGIRDNRGWITRLGVLPFGRRLGTGGAIMTRLLEDAVNRDLDSVWLEVIADNYPGYCLFNKFDFQETRELIVARRPPDPHTQILPGGIKSVTPLDHEEALILLSHREQRPNWLKETESMKKTRNLSAFLIEMVNGGRGWVSFHASLFEITRIVVEVTLGDPAEITATMLRFLHHRYKRLDAKVENITDDQVWEGFQRVGYFESFRRIEMVKKLY